MKRERERDTKSSDVNYVHLHRVLSELLRCFLLPLLWRNAYPKRLIFRTKNRGKKIDAFWELGGLECCVATTRFLLLETVTDNAIRARSRIKYTPFKTIQNVSCLLPKLNVFFCERFISWIHEFTTNLTDYVKPFLDGRRRQCQVVGNVSLLNICVPTFFFFFFEGGGGGENFILI
jgi:hypothetical protein